MKKRKFFTSLTLLFMMLFQMIPVNVNALESNTLINGEYGNVEDYLIYARHENATPDDPGAPMPVGGYGLGTKHKRDSSGNIYYCLEEQLKAPGTVTSGAPESLTSAEYNVITKGYSKSNPSPFGSGFTRGESYYITQVALWIVSAKTPLITSVSELNIYDNPTYEVSQEKFDAIIGEINKLVNEARNNPDPHLLELSLSGNAKAAYDNGTFTAGPFKIESNMTTTLSSFSIGMVNMPIGAVILDANGNMTTAENLAIGQQFFVKFPAAGNPASGEFTINAIGSLTYGAGITYAGPIISGQKYQDVATVKDLQEVIQDRNRINTTITFRNSIGTLEILKIDAESKKAVPNTQFRVTGNGIDEIVTTGTDGLGFLRDLLEGNYVVTEISVPKPYVLNSTPMNITIVGGQTVRVTQENDEAKGRITIMKQDSATAETPQGEATFEGAVFEIRNSSNEVVQTLTTDANGQAVSALLPIGTYTVKEITAPEGYLINDSTFDVNIEYIDQNTTINEQKVIVKDDIISGTLDLTKTDISTGELLPNTKIAIYKEDGTLVEEKITDENGKAVFENIRYGKYYFKETEAPDGYILNSENHPFEIKEDGEIIKDELKNQIFLGTLELTKTDISTGKLIPNTKIAIYKEDGTLVEEKVTDENGLAVFTEIRYGKYYFLESEAPEGYILNTEKHPFEVKEDGQIIKDVLDNFMITGSYGITKTDMSTGEVLPDTLISIYSEDGKLIESKRTDENGYVEFENLTYGNYYFVESDAPEGYILNTEKHPFSITENGTIVKDELKNTKIVGEIEITKKDIATDEVIPGAKIEIYDEEGNKVYEGISDKDGKITTKLEYGKYTFKETVAPNGYLINEAEGQFEIKEDGQIVKAQLYDKKEILPKAGMMDSPIALIGAAIAVIGGILMFILAGKKRKNTSKIATFMLAALLIASTFGGSNKVFATESNAFPVLEAQNIEMRVGERWTVQLHNVMATDTEDGNITRKIITKETGLPLSTAGRATETGTFNIKLSVFDKEGNTTTKDVTVTVIERVVAPENEIPVASEVTVNPDTIVVVPVNIKVNNQNIAEDITLTELQAMQDDIKAEELNEIKRVNEEANKKVDSAEKEDLPQAGTAKSFAVIAGVFVFVAGTVLMFIAKRKGLNNKRN